MKHQMKKAIILLMSIASLSSIYSCTKENDQTTSIVATPKIEGKWFIIKQGEIKNGEEILQDFTDNQPGCSKNYYIFDTDGNMSSTSFSSNCQINSVEKATWKREGNIIKLYEKDTILKTFEIIKHTDTELKMKFIQNNVVLIIVFSRN
ncbi:hypothetical protein BWK59_11635 [Flavobacterium davisii]|uniref:Lipocalin-like domain-containing protein n=2 Tax=Flavobacterium davisii TaxID=2906077 RepID=A0A246GGD3_9FLAO|nr:hypothetical protein BWK59_11635 [Flavobacterium davisii]